MSVSLAKDYSSSESQALLHAVAEELKLPLLHIARSAELARLTGNSLEETLRNVQMSADSALELVDSYMLGIELADEQQSLVLEPVSASSILYDTVQDLQDIAKRYNVELELDINGSYGPVMAHRDGLKAALFSLGAAFIEGQPLSSHHRVITIAAHRVKTGIMAGIYGDSLVSPEQLRSAYKLYSQQVRQPFSQLSANSLAGVFVARSILQAMAADLKAVRYHKQVGLAALLQPSRQLLLV